MAILEQLTEGALLIAPGTPLPPGWRLRDEPAPDGWSWLSNTFDPIRRETELKASGWTFFFKAGAIAAAAAGWNRPRMLSAGLKRLISATTLERCNCLEIGDVGTSSFFGMPRVSISAHPRHIQQGMVFRGQ